MSRFSSHPYDRVSIWLLVQVLMLFLSPGALQSNFWPRLSLSSKQDREVMDKAIDVHDNVIRTQLGRFNGYEVTTEGDAFLMAFHDASDAVAWTIATQQVKPCL